MWPHDHAYLQLPCPEFHPFSSGHLSVCICVHTEVKPSAFCILSSLSAVCMSSCLSLPLYVCLSLQSVWRLCCIFCALCACPPFRSIRLTGGCVACFQWNLKLLSLLLDPYFPLTFYIVHICIFIIIICIHLHFLLIFLLSYLLCVACCRVRSH